MRRLYCLGKLRSFDVREEMLQMFYTATVSSAVTFEMPCWGGNASKQDKKNTRQEHQGGRWGGREKARKQRPSLSLISNKQTE